MTLIMMFVTLLMIKSAPLTSFVPVIMTLVTIRMIVVVLLTRVTYALRVATPLMNMESTYIECVERRSFRS